MARGSPRQKGAGEGTYLASQPTLLFCMSLLAPFFSSTTAASTLFTAAAQCRADLPVRGEEGGSGVGSLPWHAPSLGPAQLGSPRSSTALTSAWELMRSSSMPSTARRAARISGVVPSCMRASRSVARFRIRIWTAGKVSGSVSVSVRPLPAPGRVLGTQTLTRMQPSGVRRPQGAWTHVAWEPGEWAELHQALLEPWGQSTREKDGHCFGGGRGDERSWRRAMCRLASPREAPKGMFLRATETARANAARACLQGLV